MDLQLEGRCANGYFIEPTIFAGVNNTITNSASGTITGLDDTVGIYVVGNTIVTNAGAVTVGASAGGSGGIVAINDSNRWRLQVSMTLDADGGTREDGHPPSIEAACDLLRLWFARVTGPRP